MAEKKKTVNVDALVKECKNEINEINGISVVSSPAQAVYEKIRDIVSLMKIVDEEDVLTMTAKSEEAKVVKLLFDNLSGESIENRLMLLEQIFSSQFEKPNKALINQIKERGINKAELRTIVDEFYRVQDARIRQASQIRALEQNYDTGSSHAVLLINLYHDSMLQEAKLKEILTAASETTRVGRWLSKTWGIGPVLTCALVATFDVIDPKTGKVRNSAGHFWQYAGLNDNNKPYLGRDKATKIVNAAIETTNGKLTDESVAIICHSTQRTISELSKFRNTKGYDKEDLIKYLSKPPYNAEAKKLMWKVGHQFVLGGSNKNSFYGPLYVQFYLEEKVKNESGKNKMYIAKQRQADDYTYELKEGEDPEKYSMYAEIDKIINKKTYSKSTESYKAHEQGKLSDSHLKNRAQRKVEKIFLSHLFEMMYYDATGQMAPPMYVEAHLGHKDYISPEVPFDSVI